MQGKRSETILTCYVEPNDKCSLQNKVQFNYKKNTVDIVYSHMCK